MRKCNKCGIEYEEYSTRYMCKPCNKEYNTKNREHIKKNYTWKVICQKFEVDISNYVNKYRNYLVNDYKNLLTQFITSSSTSKHDEIFKISEQLIYYPDINQYYIIKLN